MFSVLTFYSLHSDGDFILAVGTTHPGKMRYSGQRLYPGLCSINRRTLLALNSPGYFKSHVHWT